MYPNGYSPGLIQCNSWKRNNKGTGRKVEHSTLVTKILARF